MKIKLISDMHLEFFNADGVEMIKNKLVHDSDKDVVLVVAGDLHLGTEGIKFLKTIENKYKKIIYVLGNHEYYKNDFYTLINEIKNEANGTNISILENQSVTIDDCIFIGMTLWSFGDTEYIRYRQVNDYNYIQKNSSVDDIKYDLLHPIDTRERHYTSVGYLYNKLSRLNAMVERRPLQDKKIIVVSHHLPTYECVTDEFKLHTLNPFFVADLGMMIKMFNIDYWLYGHTHKSNDFEKDGIRFVCNPCDYREGNKEFKYDLIIDTKGKTNDKGVF